MKKYFICFAAAFLCYCSPSDEYHIANSDSKTSDQFCFANNNVCYNLTTKLPHKGWLLDDCGDILETCSSVKNGKEYLITEVSQRLCTTGIARLWECGSNMYELRCWCRP